MSIAEKLTLIAQNEHGVYNAGYSNGHTEGYNEGYPVGKADGYTEGKTEGYEEGFEAGKTDGKKAEYDAFWDSYQENGTRANYQFAFSGIGWNATTLRPKYTCKPIGAEAQNMFNSCYFENKNYTDLLDISHISIDVSEVTHATNMFANAKVKGVTLIFSEKVTTLINAFNKGNGGSVAGMKITLLVPNPNCNWGSAFAYHKVQELNLLEGTVIGTNGFDVRHATALPHDSIVSIINALSTTTSGLSVTLSLKAVNNAFETSSGATDGSTSTEWSTLVATRSNWTISLV